MIKDLIKKFTFSKEERDKLRNLEAGIVISEAQLDGMHIYKNAILSSVYKRLNIEGEPRKGFSKGIRYNLTENEIIYTESPIKEESVKE